LGADPLIPRIVGGVAHRTLQGETNAVDVSDGVARLPCGFRAQRGFRGRKGRNDGMDDRAIEDAVEVKSLVVGFGEFCGGRID
jgi:hypothetical protein